MISYDGYIARLKQGTSEPNYDQLFSGIEHKLHAFPKLRLAFAGTLVTGFAIALFFIGFVAGQVPERGVMSYVFEQQSTNGEILDYVFYTNGTFAE
ncbi:MAG: hypothetical protein NT099_05440 [Candidatus Saganbacteria bacterium]|nr:hypothetical protein [Candidatus Saganbacteria bacterium]